MRTQIRSFFCGRGLSAGRTVDSIRSVDADRPQIRTTLVYSLLQCSAEKKLKSAAYNGFVLLCNGKEEYAGYVKCTTCQKVIKHDIHGSGTTHLTRHMSAHGGSTGTASPGANEK